MPLGLNPVGDVLRKADQVLADAGDTLGNVRETLGHADQRMERVDETRDETRDETSDETRALLAQAQGLLVELSEGTALVKEIPELKKKLDQVHEAVTHP
jgi:uncharacterized coiled-coil DUF342 family protein